MKDATWQQIQEPSRSISRAPPCFQIFWSMEVYFLFSLDSSLSWRNMYFCNEWPREYSAAIVTSLINKVSKVSSLKMVIIWLWVPSTLTTYESATALFVCKRVYQTVVGKWIKVRIAYFYSSQLQSIYITILLLNCPCVIGCLSQTVRNLQKCISGNC